MNTIQKVALAIVAVAGATAVLLPDRQTVPVIGAVSSLFNGALKTAVEG
jgi:hypothetical protein